MAPSNIPKNKKVFSGLPGIDNQGEEGDDCLDRKFLDGSRYDETVIGSCELPLACPIDSTTSWKPHKKIKTQCLILTLCLNFSQITQDLDQGYWVGEECWINLNHIHDKKSMFQMIALSLQKRYEDQVRSNNGSNHQRLQTMHLLDPIISNVESACEEVRSGGEKGTHGRVIFHYNGHRVLPPTLDYGEIWVFNKRYDKYKSVPISTIHSWLKSPTLYVMDCSQAGCILEHLMELNTDIIEDETKDVFFLGACDTHEVLPVHPDFPADIFTACLTDPLRMSIRWYLNMRHIQPFHLTKDILDEETIEEDFAYRLEGTEVSDDDE